LTTFTVTWGLCGSPPRTGTRLQDPLAGDDALRITPARGEETRTAAACCSCRWDHPRARGGDRFTNYNERGYYGSPPRAGRRHRQLTAASCPLRITPARGEETLAHKLLISHKTSLRPFGYRLRRLEPQHAKAIGALPSNSSTNRLNQLWRFINAKISLDDCFGHRLARY
jgi:hypothetical protein